MQIPTTGLAMPWRLRSTLATPQGEPSTSGAVSSRSRAPPLWCKLHARPQGQRSGRPASTAATAAKCEQCCMGGGGGARGAGGGWNARRGSTLASAVVVWKVVAMTFNVMPCLGHKDDQQDAELPNQHQRGDDLGTLYIVMMTTMLALLLLGCWIGRATAPREKTTAKVAATQAGMPPCSDCGDSTGSSAVAALTTSDELTSVVMRRALTSSVFTTTRGDRAHVTRTCSAVRHSRDLKEWPLCSVCRPREG